MRGPFSATCTVATSATSGTATNAQSLSAASGRGLDLIRIEAAVEGTYGSTDGEILVALYKTSALTAGTSITIENLDPDTGAATPQATSSSSPTGVTTTGSPYDIPFNQRLSGLWVPERNGAEISLGGGSVYVVQITQNGIAVAVTVRLKLVWVE